MIFKNNGQEMKKKLELKKKLLPNHSYLPELSVAVEELRNLYRGQDARNLS